MLQKILLIFVTFFFQSSQQSFEITPRPAVVEQRTGYFLLPQKPIITVAGTDAQIRRLAEGFAAQIGKVSGRDTKVFAGNFRIKNGINFITNKSPQLGKNGYFLDISLHQVVITAEQYEGFVNGLKALQQLMPRAILQPTRAHDVKWAIPCYRAEYHTNQQ
jgi:hexosaminidase